MARDMCTLWELTNKNSWVGELARCTLRQWFENGRVFGRIESLFSDQHFSKNVQTK